MVMIADPAEVLADAEPDAVGPLVTLLSDASDHWARPVEDGEWWDRPAVPFHVVLHAAGAGTADVQRWVVAGADVTPFPG